MGRNKNYDKYIETRLLRSQGLSLSEVGKEIGVTKQAVHHYLAGSKVTTGLHCRECDKLICSGDVIFWRGQEALCLDCLKKHPEAGFGERLKAYRVALRMTQKDLAEKAGLSASVIRQYERGAVKNPSWNAVRKLVKIVGAGLVCD